MTTSTELTSIGTSMPARFVEFFGPAAWKTLHCVAWTYPAVPSENDKKKYLDFIRSYAEVVPCPGCRTHFQAFLDSNKPDMSSRATFAKWVYDAHDKVTRRNGKTSPTFDEVREHYSGWVNGIAPAKLQRRSVEDRNAILASPYMDPSLAVKYHSPISIPARESLDASSSSTTTGSILGGPGSDHFMRYIGLGAVVTVGVLGGLTYWHYQRKKSQNTSGFTGATSTL